MFMDLVEFLAILRTYSVIKIQLHELNVFSCFFAGCLMSMKNTTLQGQEPLQQKRYARSFMAGSRLTYWFNRLNRVAALNQITRYIHAHV